MMKGESQGALIALITIKQCETDVYISFVYFRSVALFFLVFPEFHPVAAN